MDTGTSEPDRRLVPNHVLITLRKSRGWGRPRLARELDQICRRKSWPSPGQAAIEKQIYRLETGRVVRPDDFYTRLYCEAYGKTVHELFGDIEPDVPRREGEKFRVRSHKFIPMYVGADRVDQIHAEFDMRPAVNQWTDCHVTDIPSTDDHRKLYVWPFGVAMYHLVEDLEMTAIAELSLWRLASYERDMSWAGDELHRITGDGQTGEPYVLSAYWLEEPIWSGSELDTALRLMCIPRVLLERDDNAGGVSLHHAQLVERALLRGGFDHPEIVDFGMKGISWGFASWSGVVYHPIAINRCLLEEELIACELMVQAVWRYCDYIREQVEQGSDPVVPPECGWRFLRGIRSRITTERPTETSQHRSMREAIAETSGLTRHLAQAVETLRECEGRE